MSKLFEHADELDSAEYLRKSNKLKELFEYNQFAHDSFTQKYPDSPPLMIVKVPLYQMQYIVRVWKVDNCTLILEELE